MASRAEARLDVIVEAAPAKLNLALHVRRRRDDGYHELETLFAFCRDGDEVALRPAVEWSLAITGPFAGALADTADNLVLRAARAFAAEFPGAAPQAITLDKRLPVASGIGGGSADAGATLRALARAQSIAIDDPRLHAVAATLGADVPACLAGRTTLGRGRGEHLEPLDGLPGTPVLLVNPGVAVSTAAVFAGCDGVDRGPIADGALLDRARVGRNDLAPAAIALAPVIAEVLAMLSTQPGTTLVRMSGSGATCFALFADDRARDAATDAIRRREPRWWLMESALA